MSMILDIKKGNIPNEIKKIAKFEGLSPEYIAKGVADGTIVVPRNKLRRMDKPCGIGTGLSTKVNANIGTSSDIADLTLEIEKLNTSVAAGADTVMDLSTGGDLNEARRFLIARCPVPFGTVPIYEVIVAKYCSKSPAAKVDADDIFRVIEAHAKTGVDFITVHCGLTRRAVDALLDQGRVLDIVSRGGAFLAEWMRFHERENPLFEQYDRLLEIALKYDMTLSLGDGLRPGAIADATDRAQIEELITLGELAKRARQFGVQAMIEGPGHVPLDQIKENIRLEKLLCDGAPFYVLGPLVTDCAPGYDHITSAIGGAIAASAGADFLCYVTPSEHLRLPTVDDVRDGVIASKIAAHAGDIVKGVKGAYERDLEMSKARKKRDWAKQIDLAIDPVKARAMRESSKPEVDDVCTMCGKLCSVKMVEGLTKEKKKKPKAAKKNK